MTTPEQTPDTELEVQELTDENLGEVEGATDSPTFTFLANDDPLDSPAAPVA
jgi:hypothetical protein